jgi:hypothetical protein
MNVINNKAYWSALLYTRRAMVMIATLCLSTVRTTGLNLSKMPMVMALGLKSGGKKKTQEWLQYWNLAWEPGQRLLGKDQGRGLQG